MTTFGFLSQYLISCASVTYSMASALIVVCSISAGNTMDVLFFKKPPKDRPQQIGTLPMTMGKDY